MSAVTSYDCSQCGTDVEHPIEGSFCSRECYLTARGESVTNQIAVDHTYCSSCFAKRKEIDKPTEEFLARINIENGFETEQAIVGFQYHTPNVEREHGFTFCKCGNIDHYAEIGELRDIHLKDVIMNLWHLLVDYYDKEQFGDHKPDKEVLFETLKASEMDFAYSIGKSVYSE